MKCPVSGVWGLGTDTKYQVPGTAFQLVASRKELIPRKTMWNELFS